MIYILLVLHGNNITRILELLEFEVNYKDYLSLEEQ